MSSSPASVPGQGISPTTFPIRFVDFWWVTIPRKLRRYSTLLWAAWSDGLYLTKWPRLATALVAAVFLFGLIEGGTHWSALSLDGYGLQRSFHPASFAQMLPLMVLAVLLGSWSANLGLTLVIGFAMGDFFWAGVPFSPWERNITLPGLYGRVPQVAAYLVFFFLAAWPTIASKFLVAAAHRRFRESDWWKTALMVVVQVLFIYDWTYFAPMGVKQQWDCCSQTSPLDVRYFHNTTFLWLGLAAAFGLVGRRLVINHVIGRDEAVIARWRAVCDPALEGRPGTPRWLGAIIGAAVTSLLLLGFTTFALRSALMFVILAAILLARSYVLPGLSWWKAWTTTVVRWPALLRLAFATILTYAVCRLILLRPGFGASDGFAIGNFGPEIAAILVGYVALLALLPNGALAPQEAEMTQTRAAMRASLPSRAVQAGIVIAFVLLATKRAFAAACTDTRCCFNGDNGQAATSTSAAAPTVSGTIPIPPPSLRIPPRLFRGQPTSSDPGISIPSHPGKVFRGSTPGPNDDPYSGQWSRTVTWTEPGGDAPGQPHTTPTETNHPVGDSVGESGGRERWDDWQFEQPHNSHD